MAARLKVAKAPEKVRLDLGAGFTPREGFIGVDNAKDCKPGVLFDLRKTPWPWKDESVDEVWCSHFLEHLTGPERIEFMQELWRVLRVGAQATIITPYWSSMRAVQDPTHQWPPVCEASYLYFNKAWREQNKLTHYGAKCDFDFGYGYSLDGMWQARSQDAVQFAVRNYTNAVADLQVTLTKRA